MSLLEKYTRSFIPYEWTDEDQAKWKQMRNNTHEINYEDKLKHAPQKIFTVDFGRKELLNVVEIHDLIPVDVNKVNKKGKKVK